MITAAQIVQDIHNGSLNASQVLEQHLAHVDALEPRVQAWPTVDTAGARRAAAELDAHPSGGLLAGVPVGVKDIYDVAGLVTGCGSLAFAAFTPDEDATTVERLRAAGAVITGKTATTDFAFLDPAQTRNPWNLDHTPGGSSSGSAAAVAAGMVPVALGTQTVGSVLRPAAYCGVVGLKPSHGRVSLHGIFPLAPSFDHPGIFSHSVLDAAIVLQAIAGYDPRDAISFDVAVDDYIGAAGNPAPGPVLGLPWTYTRDRAGAEVIAEIERVARLLSQAGATLREIDLPYSAQAIRDLGEPIFMAEAASVHRELFAQHEDEYRPRLRAHLSAGRQVTAVDYLEAQSARGQLKKDLATALEGVDALLIPVAPSTAPAGLESTGDAVFCAPASFAGLPAIALPSGVSGTGLPLAVQLVGRSFAEAALIRVASWVERQLKFTATAPLVAR